MDKNCSAASNYLVSFNTIALVPIRMEYKLYTRVIENHTEFLVKMKPSSIIKKSLIYYGNSYKLATFYSREAIGRIHKPPLLISHDYGVPLIMFPTLSAESEGNIWISSSAIDYFSLDSHKKCLVHFTNSSILPVNVSLSTMCRQHTFSHFLTRGFQKKRNKIDHPFSQSILMPPNKKTKR